MTAFGAISATSFGEMVLNGFNDSGFFQTLGIAQATGGGNALYVSLHTANPTDVAATALTNECNSSTNYQFYARSSMARYGSYSTSPPSAAWAAVASSIVNFHNVSQVQFPACGAAASGAVATHWAIWDALTNGNMLFYGPLVASGTEPVRNASINNASTDFTSFGHGFIADDRVVLMNVYDTGGYLGGDMPAPGNFTLGTRYFVLAAGLTADVFRLSTTSGGAAITASSAGTALATKSAALTINTNVIPAIPAQGLRLFFT